MAFLNLAQQEACEYLPESCINTPFDPPPDINKALWEFEGIDLDRLDKFKLLKRYDTKFVFRRDQLKSILNGLGNDYSVLTIDGKRAFGYETLYFDTEDGFFFRQHHDQRVNRFKVRVRHYVDSGRCYVEVKRKTNKKKTIKTRLELNEVRLNSDLDETSRTFAESCLDGYCPSVVTELKPTVRVHYSRVTLVNHVNCERLTFDLNLSFSDPFGSRYCDHLVIAELKHSRLLAKSSAFDMLRSLNIHPTKFSKYCMGMVLMEKHSKTNRFKTQVRLIEKLS